MSMWLWYLHFLLDVSVKRKWFQHHLSGLPFTSTKQHTPKLTKRYLSRPRDTQPVRTLFLFKSIWIRLQGSQGCQKMCKDPLNMPFEVWCANIAPERHKLRKTIKIGKKCQKTAVFLDIFKYSSIWGQY